MSRWNAFVLVLPLLALLAGCRNPVGDGPTHRQVAGVVITHMGDNEWATAGPNGAWSPGLPVLQVGEERAVRIYFLDPGGQRFQLPLAGATHTLRVEFDPAGIVAYQGSGEQGVLRGVAAGHTEMVVMVWHGTHPDFATDRLRIEVLP